MGVILHLSADMYELVRSHVLQSFEENVAFLYVEPSQKANGFHLKALGVHLIPPEGLEISSGTYFLELTDEEKSRVIVEASRLGRCARVS